ncbi:MAG TPA: aminotransferase class I/II-fold pyridoxal phosphate-dependent enzyme, partial [Thermomicrobiales bacterium]|nr:aminotransferase class I/II-fold pyridoxal phosphate-dependent enzyme [Thermomicrobiales bacterium]
MPLDQQQRPFIDFVRSLRARDVTTYLSIGHKLGAAATPEIRELLGDDVFASNTWLNADHYNDALHAAEALAADAWGADHTFYLVDGSSSGNHALFLAALRPGDEVIVSRDLHWSMLVALIMTGAVPRYVAPRLHPELDIAFGIAAEDVAAALTSYPAAKLVAIVSPSFCGVASDLEAIAAVAHARDVPLYVDEAWGAHFHFHPDLPASAMASGADAAVASVHKLLPALSQGSVLHVRGSRLDLHRINQTVHMTQTTSPLLPI